MSHPDLFAFGAAVAAAAFTGRLALSIIPVPVNLHDRVLPYIRPAVSSLGIDVALPIGTGGRATESGG